MTEPMPKVEAPRNSTAYRRLLVAFAVGLFFLVGTITLAGVGLFYAVDQAKLAARRTSSAHNLKNIVLAMHAYHDEHGKFPRAGWTLPDGGRTRSWRVSLLPYLEQKQLFEQIRSDEPWNSDANRTVTRYRPSLFRIPVDDDRSDSDTDYLVITGPGTLFEEGRDLNFAACTDGPANTIIAVEVLDSGIHWAEPRDLDIRTMVCKINQGGAQGIRSPWKGGAYVAFADGSVRFLPDETLEANLRAMISRNGDEVVNPDGVTPPKVLTGQ